MRSLEIYSASGQGEARGERGDGAEAADGGAVDGLGAEDGIGDAAAAIGLEGCDEGEEWPGHAARITLWRFLFLVPS